MQRKVEIVFRRKVRAVWLDHGLLLAAKGKSWVEAKPLLAKEIAAENSGAETIRKVLEHVRRIWFEPPVNCAGLRADALSLYLSSESQNTRSLLNWGMAIAAHPFVGSVAEALGRLLKLHKEANRAAVQRRLREQYGDRDFVNRITRYNISSFLDWGIILESEPKGTYSPGRQIRCQSPGQIAWAIEAVLLSRGEVQMSYVKLWQHPVLFPLKLEGLNSSSIKKNPRLEVARHGLNEDLVHLNGQVNAGSSIK